MSPTTLPDTQDSTTQYSGASPPGLNPHASFDRVVWNGSQDLCTQRSHAEQAVAAGIDALQTQRRSRLIVRLRASFGCRLPALEPLMPAGCTADTTEFINPDDGLRHVSIGVNTAGRSMSPSDRLQAQSTVQQTVERLSPEIATPRTFTRQGLDQLMRIQGNGMSFDTAAQPDELYRLWHDTFGWTREQCAAVPSSEDERVFLLRDRIGQAVCAMLFSGGESTEWSTVPQYQGKGLIVPLLLYSHCRLLRDDIRSVFAELRWNRSVSPGLRSGLKPAISGRSPWMLTNHVTIGRPEGDAPDPWNSHRQRFGDTDGTMLRSFAVAHLDTALFTDELMDAYLSSPADHAA